MFLSLWFSPLPFPPFPCRPWVLPVRQGQRSISSVGVKFHATTKTLTRVKWYRGHCYKQAWCITMTDLSTMWLSFVILEIPRFLCGSSRGASALIKQQNECSVSQLRRSLGFWLASSFVDTGQLDTHTHTAPTEIQRSEAPTHFLSHQLRQVNYITPIAKLCDVCLNNILQC